MKLNRPSNLHDLYSNIRTYRGEILHLRSKWFYRFRPSLKREVREYILAIEAYMSLINKLNRLNAEAKKLSLQEDRGESTDVQTTH